jgi:multidrug efflux pump
VQVFWPGATAQQMADQVTDKLEKTLQEVPYADKIRSYSKPGESLTIFQVKDSSPPQGRGNSWYQVRKKVGDMRARCRQGVIGPFFNDDFGDVYGSIYALSADGFTRGAAEHADACASGCCGARRGQGRAVRRAGREGLRRDLAEAPGAAGPGFEPGARADRRAERGGGRPGRSTPTRNLQVRVGGQFNTVDELRRCRSAPSTRRERSGWATSRDPARLRRPAAGEGAPPGPRGHRAGRLDGQGRRHHRARQALHAGPDASGRAAGGHRTAAVQDQPQAVVSRSVGEFVGC